MCNCVVAYIDDGGVVELIQRLVLQTQLNVTGKRANHLRFVAAKTLEALVAVILLVLHVVVFLAVVLVQRVHVFALYYQVRVVSAVFRGTRAGGAVAFRVQPNLGVPEGVGAFFLVFEKATFRVPRSRAFLFSSVALPQFLRKD